MQMPRTCVAALLASWASRLARSTEMAPSGKIPLPVAADRADRVAQATILTGRLTELDRELGQQVLGAQVAARASDLLAERLRHGEVLEQGDDVGKGFMEREDIRDRRLAEPTVEAIP